MLSTILHVYHAGTLYECVIKDNSILRITKYIGQTQTPRDQSFNDLPFEVKRKLVDQYNETTRKLRPEDENES